YNGFEKTGHPVGKRLKNYQASEMEEVWLKANLAPHDPRREGMAGKFDKKWFLETYCEHPETLQHLSAKDAIWPHVKKICLFDPISVLACSPSINGHLFKPVLVETQGVTHQIIGLSKNQNGVQDQSELRNALSALGKSVLGESLSTGKPVSSSPKSP
ncbi:MAG: hypothetical protein K2X66_09770, partial [Cyanobacteria bacterium]|nr:hypothetical protein [Cyanobacteriota bacterium]